MIFSRYVLVRNFKFSDSVSDISLNNAMPNPPGFVGRANNLLSSVEHTTPPVMIGKNSVIIRSPIIFIVLLIFSIFCIS